MASTVFLTDFHYFIPSQQFFIRRISILLVLIKGQDLEDV
jgi:hypothetical protein